ncbi:MAG: hypothetical protein Q9182_007239 [Xanthomendoza sp. 2 TL-2023]
MHRICMYFLCILFLSSATVAAPAKLRKRSFKIQQRRIVARSTADGARDLGRAYRKYSWTVPEALSSKVSTAHTLALGDPSTGTKDEDSDNATTEEGDASFLSPIKVGGQPLMMNFDTGSSDLWVFSTSLKPQQTRGHSVFDPSKSNTFKPLQGASWSITYGDKSSASGKVGTDTVDIGGAVVEGQAVELATAVSDSFVQDANSDGLVGLAFGTINTVKPQPQKTFFENVQASLDKPVFTANLRHHELGSYEFGRIDDSQFEGSITYTPVDPSRGFWEIESKSYAVGDGEVRTNPNASPAIVDTGTTLILADEDVVKSYWSQVEGAKMEEEGITFPCNSQLPDFHIALGATYMATVPGELINFQRVNRGICFGGLQSNNGGKLQIYGDVLLKSQFVVFDGEKKAVGFAPHK